MTTTTLSAVELIAAEVAHREDDPDIGGRPLTEFVHGELVDAALCHAALLSPSRERVEQWWQWPFVRPIAAPIPPVDRLVKAAALLAAEIDRLQAEQ